MADKPSEALTWAVKELKSYWRIREPGVHSHLLLDLDALGIDFRTSVHKNRIEFLQKSLNRALDDQSAIFFEIRKSDKWRMKYEGIGILTQEVKDFFRDPLGSALPKEIPNDSEWFKHFKHFMQEDPHAISHPIVAHELAELRRRNTDESLSQLKELLDVYVVRDSKVKGDKRRKEIERWVFDIHPALKEEERKIENEENDKVKKDKWYKKLTPRHQKELARERIGKKYKVSPELISRNLPVIKEIESLTDNLKYYLRHEIASHYASNDSLGPLLLRKLFCTHPHLKEIVPDIFEICYELALYKKFRQTLTGQEYLPGHFILKLATIWNDDYETHTTDFDLYHNWTPPKPEKSHKAHDPHSLYPPKIYVYRQEKPPEFYVYPSSRSQFQKVITQISQHYNIPTTTLMKIYKDYRMLEAQINSELDWPIWKKMEKDPELKKIFRYHGDPSLQKFISGFGYWAMLWTDGVFEK